ncbi:MAG: HRDC domain-containing protein [Rubrivivax sp.]|nr:HRDC domain-containing protein [Rubrivivax sp.]
MSLHCFTIRALEPEADQEAVNTFCASQRVLRVERHFVADGTHSFWAVCVEVADGPGPLPDALKRQDRRERQASAKSGASAPGAGKPDYKHLLSETDFNLFAALRQWRKTQAEADGVPLYAVFTNEQLAAIAQRRCETPAELGEIDGVGPARVQRYGAAVLDNLRAAMLSHGVEDA